MFLDIVCRTVAASGSPDTAVATPDLTLSSDDDWFVVTPVAPPSEYQLKMNPLIHVYLR